MSWTVPESKLIQEIYKNPCIWNKRSDRFGDTKYKDIIWKKLAADLCQPEEICRTRWESLRDRFMVEASSKTDDEDDADYDDDDYDGDDDDDVMLHDFHCLTEGIFENGRPKTEDMDEAGTIEYLDEYAEEYEDPSAEKLDMIIIEEEGGNAERATVDEESSRSNYQKNTKRSKTKNKENNRNTGTKRKWQPEKIFQELSASVVDYVKTKKRRLAHENFLGAIGEFFNNVPEDRRLEYKMDILSFAHRKSKEYK